MACISSLQAFIYRNDFVTMKQNDIVLTYENCQSFLFLQILYVRFVGVHEQCCAEHQIGDTISYFLF